MTTENEVGAGDWLQHLSWIEAEALMRQGRTVVVPLGAAAKEHGPHLPLNNDALIAEWLAREVALRLPVIIAPLINASYYPAFAEYPGSISLREETARDLIVDSCRSLALHGVDRFYVLNTGLSTESPLEKARRRLNRDGIQFEFLRLGEALQGLPDGLLEQTWGSHADEHETSLMLHIAPEVVDMTRALDDGAEGQGRLSRTAGQGVWSASGIYGQATLADANKGRLIAEVIRDHVLAQIEAMNRARPAM